jgi:hypothetical protein
MSEEFTTPEINEAWERIAHTADGQIIYRHLQKLVMALSADVSALPVHEGGRILARNLMSLMAQGIVDSDRYAIAFPTAKPVAATGTRGAGRRVTVDTFVPGYSDFGPTGGAGNSGTGTNGTGSGAG